MARFTDGRDRFEKVIRKMARFTDGRDRFEEIIRKMSRFTDNDNGFRQSIRKTANITDAGGLGEEFAEDLERVYVYRGFGVIFYVAEDLLCYFVSGGSVQRYEHGVGKREGHELFHDRIMIAHERHKVLRLRTET